MRFRAYGCPHVIAACEASLCADFEGRKPGRRPTSSIQTRLCERLSVPVEKTGRILVLEDARSGPYGPDSRNEKNHGDFTDRVRCGPRP